jgi:hypothetical protein
MPPGMDRLAELRCLPDQNWSKPVPIIGSSSANGPQAWRGSLSTSPALLGVRTARPARRANRGCGPYIATASQGDGSEDWSHGNTAAVIPACSRVVKLMRLTKCRPGWL